MSNLNKGNECLRKNDFQKAISYYQKAVVEYPEISNIINNNIELAKIRKKSISNSDKKNENKTVADLQKQGVSIIILTYNGAILIEKLLDSFFSNNSYNPIEIIIIDHGSIDATKIVVDKYNKKGLIRYFERGDNYSFSSSCNYGAKFARYSFLLFLNNDIIFTNDVLSTAINKTIQNNIGVVGIRLNNIKGTDEEKIEEVNHAGIEFVWNTNRKYYMPQRIRNLSKIPEVKKISIDNTICTFSDDTGFYPAAITGAFLLCQKSDLEQLGGFSELYYYGLEDVDFCLRIQRDLNKRVYCITSKSLEHNEGTTRKQDKILLSERIDKNHSIFRKKWSDWIASRNLISIPFKIDPNK